MFLLATEFATIAFFLGFMAVMFSAVYWFQQRRRQVRQQAMRALAGALEAQYSENDQMGLRNQLKPFDLFRRERIRFFNTSNLSNILHKKVGEASVYLFDYSYVVSTGKSSKRITQTVFFANNRNWHLPQFTLKPSSWW
ncbi:MAG: hypothetical protein KGS48_16325, partial [Bacteroidetes bacterium]|nr:hypothetical protein [Bacteroidota bacterium]